MMRSPPLDQTLHRPEPAPVAGGILRKPVLDAPQQLRLVADLPERLHRLDHVLGLAAARGLAHPQARLPRLSLRLDDPRPLALGGGLLPPPRGVVPPPP